MKKIKVAISQRIIPHYRVPVFTDLSRRSNIDLTVFYGEGFKNGSQVNSNKISGFRAVKLNTIFLNYKGTYGSIQLRVWHPFLFFQLIKGRFDVVITEPTTNFYNDIFVYLYCKLFRKKLIWHESGSIPKTDRPLHRRLIDPVVSLIIKRADAFVTYTSFADKSLVRDFPNIDPNKIFRAQNTVDTTKIEEEKAKFESHVIQKKKELGLSEYKVCLYIGGIEKRKRINNLITASNNLNHDGIPCKTIIVGDGIDKDWVIGNMNDEERQNTLFLGKQIEEATLYILISDVVVLPSAGGLSVIQAFACGKPFVGSEEIEYGGIVDYVSNGIDGFLVKEDDINSLQKALRNLFCDEKNYKLICENAFKKSKELTIEKMVDGFENAIKFCYN